MATYSVVAFMVNVRLVENKVNKKEGMDMVASLIVKYNTSDVSCNIQRINLARSPSQEEEP